MCFIGGDIFILIGWLSLSRVASFIPYLPTHLPTYQPTYLLCLFNISAAAALLSAEKERKLQREHHNHLFPVEGCCSATT